MWKKNQIIGGVFLSYAAQIIQVLITLFYTPIMLKLLGQSDYGLYQLAFSTVSYLSLFTFGFSSSYIKFYSTAKAGQNSEQAIASVNGMFMLVFCSLGLIVLSIGSILVLKTDIVLGGKLTDVELKKSFVLMAIMVVNCTLQFPATVFNNYIIANEKFVWMQAINIVTTIINPCMTFPMLLMGYGSISLCIVLLVITILKLLLASMYAIKFLKMRFIFINMQWGLLKDVSKFSFFIFLESVISTINIGLDRFLLGKMVGSISVAIYAVGGQLNTLYTTLSQTICSVFTPRINRLVTENNKDKELSELFSSVGKVQYIVLLAVLSGFIIFGKRFMILWAGDEYLESYYIALILMAPNTINLIQNIGVEILRAKNMQKYRSLAYVGIAIANIIVSIILIKRSGAIGAALGTCFAWIIGGGFFMNWFFCKYVNLDIISFWKEIVRTTLCVIPPVAIIKLFEWWVPSQALWLYIIKIVFYSLIYMICVCSYGLTKEEKRIILSRINRGNL